MKKRFQELLIAQDHFGITPSFIHKGRYQYHTLLCEVISLVMNLGCFAFFITLLVELVRKNKPTVNHVSLQQSKGPNGTLNSEDLIVSFGLLDQNYRFFNDPTYLTFEATYEVDTIENGEFVYRNTKMNQINCTEINLNRYEKYGYQDIFLSNNLNDYYCYDKTDIDDKIIIGGIFGSEFYGCIHAILKKCQNSSDSDIICKSEEEINEKINGFWFEMFFLDHFVDIYNYSSPIQTFSNSLYSMVTPDFYKSLHVYYNGVTVNTDRGVLFDRYKEETSFKYEKMNFDLIGNKDNGDLIEFILISSFTEEIYNRSYIKIQDLFSNVGGILSGMSLAGIIILSFFEQKRYEIELIKSLFHFTTVKEKLVSFQDYSSKSRNNAKMYNVKESTAEKEHHKKKIKFNLTLMDVLCMKNKRYSNERTKMFEQDIELIEKEVNKKIEFSSNILIQNNVYNLEKVIMNKICNSEKGKKFLWILNAEQRKEKKISKKEKDELKESASTLKDKNYSIQKEYVNQKRFYSKSNDDCKTSDSLTEEKNISKTVKAKNKDDCHSTEEYCKQCKNKINKVKYSNTIGLCKQCYKLYINK